MRTWTYVLFFLSGISGLVYQIVWVRLFGNAFGNTVHSAALVTAMFIGGLGVGSYLIGRLGDAAYRRQAAAPVALYGLAEVLIGLLCLGLAFVLPALSGLSADLSAYQIESTGWHSLSLASHLVRYLMGAVLIAPPAILMGGTLTLLIRHLVGDEPWTSGWRIGWLYGLNTLGAALGCFLTDFILIPELGLLRTQALAAAINTLAGLGGLVIFAASRRAERARASKAPPPTHPTEPGDHPHGIRLAGAALFLSGLAALGLEIVWFRHIGALIGSYRMIFSLLLTVVLVGIWLGSVLGGWLERRFGRAGMLWIVAQATLAASVLLLLAVADQSWTKDYLEAHYAQYIDTSALGRRWLQVVADLRLILVVVGLPAVCMGIGFPLANALVQRNRQVIGRRSGVLYLATTAGNLAGSLLAGFLILPVLGTKTAAAIFALCAILACLPIYRLLTAQTRGQRHTGLKRVVLASLGVGLLSLVGYGLLPGDHLVMRCFPQVNTPGAAHVLAVSEGENETLMITQTVEGRHLLTNGYAMSATGLGAQRYMRAFSHIPLLQMESPRQVLVICFGVGNTVHAASLHPSVETVEVVDLSRNILRHSHYFRHSNRNVLSDPRTEVYVNDGRHHLHMQPPGSYDLITLEPPPLGTAGVSALYTREFFALAHSRLRPGGVLTHWLPAHQLPEQATLTLVRAFMEIFPNGMLLNGSARNMILYGPRGGPSRLDPAALDRILASRPAVQADLQTILMASPVELAGTFAASSQTLQRATTGVRALTDDWPMIDYAVHGRMKATRMPAAIFDVSDARAWCTACFQPELLAGAFKDLPAYLAIMQRIYHSEAFLASHVHKLTVRGFELTGLDAAALQAISHSAYLRGMTGRLRR